MCVLCCINILTPSLFFLVTFQILSLLDSTSIFFFLRTDARTQVVGFVVSSIVWREALENVFAEDVSGVDCVLKTDGGRVFTFGVEDGIPVVRGEGDLHDPTYDEYKAMIDVVQRGDFSNDTVTYTLEVYPTQEFFESDSTDNPIIGMAGALGIILLISGLFYIFDSYVRKEFDANNELLESKRRFVRFVSHEVRTPLNTVCMGLTLLQEDLQVNSGRSIPRHDLSEEQRLLVKQKEEANLPPEMVVKQETATEWIGLSEDILSNTQTAKTKAISPSTD